jgi:hypothetical protein
LVVAPEPISQPMRVVEHEIEQRFVVVHLLAIRRRAISSPAALRRVARKRGRGLISRAMGALGERHEM